MTDLSTTYLGFRLRAPLVASPSPLTSSLADLLRLEAAGVGAVVLPSLFEEEIEAEATRLNDHVEAGSGVNAEGTEYFADFAFDHLLLDRHLELTEGAARRLDIPVIASLNGNTAGGWVHYAQELVTAGAAAIELNMYDVALDPTRSAAQVEDGYLELVRSVRAAIDVPLAVKISPYFSSLANMAMRIVEAGADGLVLFNRFYQPDLDLETLDVKPTLNLSHAGEIRLPLRWVAILRPHLPETSLALTSGVHLGTEIAKGLLAGADVVMATAELLRRGPERASELISELSVWMDDHDYESVTQLKGSMTQHTSGDPSAFERAQYQRVLHSWKPEPAL
ncbi:MAG: dihydroorotate dehydrogenase-like protein [Actinomycetes bacterium]